MIIYASERCPPAVPLLMTDFPSSVGATLLKVAYGLQISEANDKYISTFEEAMESIALLLSGTTFIEFFPFLARLPTWFPGMEILRRMAHYRQVIMAMKEDTWNDAKIVVVVS